MPSFQQYSERLYSALLSENARKKIEKIILYIALTSFIIHLLLIYLTKIKVLNLIGFEELLNNPIAAIYTPFSFILIYEVYLLIYYLPKSFTTYITKQYEIISLIIIRKLFKDLANLELSVGWFEIKGDIQFTYDIVATLVIFYLIFLFQKYGQRKASKDEKKLQPEVQKFIRRKKAIAVYLVPIFFLIALSTLLEWIMVTPIPTENISEISKLNSLFFDKFFTVLILIDVVILLISFFYTDKFHKIMRNSGFVVSTILIRMSFGTNEIISTILIVFAILFGLIILTIHNQYEKERYFGD